MRNALGAVQSVLVLGGGSDIAGAIVTRLITQGCRTVVLAGRDPSSLEPRATAVRAMGAQTVETVAFDATQPETHAALVEDLWQRHGDLDVVLLAFGVLGEQAALERNPLAAARLVTTNFTGAVSVGLSVAQALRSQGHGTLVVLSSVAGERVRKANAVYGASKAGLDGFAQGLGDVLAGSGARVLVVRPGFVRTAMTEGLPAAPFATTPEAVAEAVVRGLASGAHTVWVPAVLRPVFAVLRLLPRPLWRRLPG